MLSRRDLLKTLSLLFAGSIFNRQSSATSFAPEEDLTQFINPMIGTGGHGHTYPGATVPFGMVQLSPDNGVNGWDWCSGYHYSSDKIVGFSHTHLSGTGIGDMMDIAFMPSVSKPNKELKLRSSFHHEMEEEASPGRYFVVLRENLIQVNLTATKRAAFHHYSFPPTFYEELPIITVNLAHSYNWDSATEAEINIENETTISGYRKSKGWAAEQQIYFVAQFSENIKSHRLIDGEQKSEAKTLRGKGVRGDFYFSQQQTRRPIRVKVGISATSIEAAKRNLEAEIPHWNFGQTADEAKAAWNRELQKVKLKTENRKLKTTFYTSLYHAYLAPTLFNDVDGSYRGADGKIHKGTFDNYTTFSLWDTFRAAHPLYTILQPERVDSMAQSMMAFYREHGLLPVWSLMGNETNTMIGYHSIPVIVDAIQKGLTKIDEKEAFEAMKKGAFQRTRGLQYYQLPEYTTREKLYEKLKRNDMKAIETEQAFELHINLVAGYAKTIGGNTIGYHSSQPNVNEALIARTAKNKNIIEWETASIAGKTSRTSTNATTLKTNTKSHDVSFVWLFGIDVDKKGHKFDLYVNGEKWFTFNSPKDRSQTSFEIPLAKKGATLNFRATHIDGYGDMFGYMWLTLPAEVAGNDPLRLKVVGEDAGTDDWYMVFEHTVGNRMTVSNVYELAADGFVFQFFRVDIESTEIIGDVRIEFREKKEEILYRPNFTMFFVSLGVGLNTVFIFNGKVDKDTPYDFRLAIGEQHFHEQVFTLRPVKPFGYIPADLENESVSKTLEYAYDDWCIAQLAKRLNKPEDYKLFSERSEVYKNLFDKNVGFMRGRLSDGSWKTPFSPKFSSHRQDEYTEGNAWQYSWFVPHDVEGLIALMGGREAFIKKLDQLFNESSVIEGTSVSPDISGLIGQYAHGNEPSHHIAYLYTLAGAHHKTENIVRQITSTLYNDTPDGLCGNEDCGQMSAWYIFSTLGFYPVNPASNVYVLGTPHFDKVEIDVGNGKTFTVLANRLSDTNKYIQSVTLNGKPLSVPFIKHQEIMNGGKLVFEMGSKLNEKLFNLLGQ